MRFLFEISVFVQPLAACEKFTKKKGAKIIRREKWFEMC